MNSMYLHRYSRMVHDYYEKRVRDIISERRERIDKLKTRKDALAYVKKVKTAVEKSFGLFPKKTPLKAVVTGKNEYNGYSIEKVIFESRPDFYVTGNLYMPKVKKGKVPCVLGLCGHSNEGKACDAYQSFCQGLALRGFAVFIIDPISQGERKQFYPEEGEVPGLCAGHNLMGNQMALIDDFFGSWRVWDGIRGLDYLLSRPEVDTSRVGVTGNSGGGTLSTYVTALDPRVTMAAPSCFICSYLANLENELPSDAEQNPPGIIAAGLDQVDLLLCYAPRPTLILGQHDDFFDARFTRQSGADLKKIHTLLGSKNTADVFIGPRGHGYFQENREAMYAWFMKHAGIKASSKETDIAVIEEQKLHVTSSGGVREKKSKRVFEITAERAGSLSGKNKALSTEKLKKTAEALLSISKSSGVPHYKALRWAGGTDESLNKRVTFAVETENGIQVAVSTYGPQSLSMHFPAGKVNLYVGNTSSYDDIHSIKEINEMTKNKIPLVAVEPRGLGQSLSTTCGSTEFFEPYGADYLYASTAEMLGESYLGRRVYDVMRVMDCLKGNGVEDIELIGRGLGSIIVVFAALLHKSGPQVKIINYLPSYRLIAESPVYKWPLSSLLRGVLKHFDLPDVYKALGRKLTKENPWGPDMQLLK